MKWKIINKNNFQNQPSEENNNKEENIEVENSNQEQSNVEEIQTNEENIGGAVEEQNNLAEPIEENTVELSQMEKDANYVKENFNIIKPIEGIISSKYGLRNPTTTTVPTTTTTTIITPTTVTTNKTTKTTNTSLPHTGIEDSTGTIVAIVALAIVGATSFVVIKKNSDI